MDGFIGYRRPYDARSAYYDTSEVLWDEDFPTAASCAACNKDVTQLFQKLRVLTLYTPGWNER